MHDTVYCGLDIEDERPGALPGGFVAPLVPNDELGYAWTTRAPLWSSRTCIDAVRDLKVPKTFAEATNSDRSRL